MKKSAMLLIICLLTCLIGCDSGGETAVSHFSTSMPIPTNTPVTPTPKPIETYLSPSPTAIPLSQTLVPTATATFLPTVPPDFSCPQPGGNAILERPVDFQEFSEKLVAYLNQVGTIEQLPEQLDALDTDHEIFPVDMNNDGILELVLNVALYSEASLPYKDHGTIVLQCRGGSYESIFALWEGPYHFFDYTLSDDMNNDGHIDVIILEGFAGSACTLEPVVLIWSENAILNASPDYLELEFGCSQKDRITTDDIDGDGTKELIISGSTVGHLDYAPPRTITQTFALQNGTYRLQTTEFGQPEYLVHLLDDAQRELDSDDLITAAQLYEDVAQNQTLPTVYSYNIAPTQTAEELGVEPDHPQEYQQAFALFRLAALHTVLANTAKVDWALAQLQERFPEGKPGSEFISLTMLMVNALRQGNSPESSCEIVLQEIEQTYPELVYHYYWGGNIAWYRNETICPFAEPFYQ